MSSDSREGPSRFKFRESTRTPLEVPATVLIAGGEIQAKTANVSLGGVFISLPKPPPVGTMVKFALDLNEKAVRGFSEVVWIRPAQESLDRPVGMGLQFRHFLDDGEGALRLFLAEQLQNLEGT